MIKKLVGGILIIGVVGAVLGLGSDETSTTEPAEETQSSRCIAVNDSDLITSLYYGDGFEVQNVYAVKSNDFELAHFISAETINSGSNGIDGEVITWLAAGELNDISYLEGVGGFGEEYSSWGSAIENKQGSAYDDGYSESRDCVK